MALSLMTFCVVNAQNVKDEISKSVERAQNLQKLCDDYKTCGDADVDGYGNSMRDAAVFAIANSEQLENLYKREIGESKDGVQDVTVKKPTLDEWLALASTIAGEGVKIKDATVKASGAATAAKNLASAALDVKNPMKAAKAVKTAKAATAVVTFGTKAAPILAEESAAQAKAVKQIIDMLKSGKNLYCI